MSAYLSVRIVADKQDLVQKEPETHVTGLPGLM